MEDANYIGRFIGYAMLIVRVRFNFLLKGLVLALVLGTLSEGVAKGQDLFKDENEPMVLPYDEIPVLVRIEGYGDFYIDAIYTKNDLLYVNIENLFATLQIPCIATEKGDKLDGFIGKDNHPYSIDYAKGYLKAGDNKVNPKDGLLKEMGSIYMESYLFADLFGITLNFNFRSLTILLKSDFELPYVKQQRIEKLRGNMAKVKGEIIADTVVKRNYHLFQTGTLDWSVASFQAAKGPGENRFGLGIGTEFLYGEANVAINYSDRYKFDNRQLYYLWRWVDNDKSVIKQAQVGKISNQTISFISAPIVGAVIRNSPTTVRKATGDYTISEITEPNWIVELYINDVMVDYMKADASGLYVFKVPIVYGYTTLKLKFYGPLGEERTEERTMNRPYTVMPTGEFEYGLSGGMVQDNSSSRFGRAEFNYGINRFITIGGGMEYLSSIANGAFIPFAATTVQPVSKLTINAEYAHGVRARGLINYYFTKSALLEIDYAKYVDGQQATLFHANEERKIKLSVPFKIKKLMGFSKIDYAQLVYAAFQYNQSNATLSAYYKQFSANSNTQLNWIGRQTPYVTSDLSLSCRLKNGIIFRPSAQYNVSENRLMTCKLIAEKSIPKGYVTATYERSLIAEANIFSINFKYDLNFARINANATLSNGNLIFSESAQGSLVFGGGNNYIHTSNNSSVSKGGLSLYPFLDVNHNGLFDADEHLVKLYTVKISGGRAIFSEKDSIIRIPDLNPFTYTMVEFEDNDLENIAWRFTHKKYSIMVDPNQFKRVDIPVVPFGEASGMAYMNTDNSLKGIGRILVKFYPKDSQEVVAETLSETDGYIYYLGFEPGDYIARIDSVQLATLQMVSSPNQIPVHISQSIEGDVVGGLDFTLRLIHERPSDTVAHLIPATPAIADKITRETARIRNIPHLKIVGKTFGSVIQVGAFINRRNALRTENKLLLSNFDYPITVIKENRFYKVQISGFKGRIEAIAFLPALMALGYPDAFVVRAINTSK